MTSCLSAQVWPDTPDCFCPRVPLKLKYRRAVSNNPHLLSPRRGYGVEGDRPARREQSGRRRGHAGGAASF